MMHDEPLTIEQKVQAIFAAVNYKAAWTFRMLRLGLDQGVFVQVEFDTPDGWQRGRKWYVSPHSTRSEIVQTLFMAVKAAEEHETRERFTYCGQAIFGPHHDVAALADFCRTETLDVRK